MHDVVFSEEHAEANTTSVPEVQKPHLFERVARKINEWGGHLAHQHDKPGELKLFVPLAEPIQKKKFTMPRGVIPKARRAIVRAGEATGNALQKPGRRTAVVHSVILAGLFAGLVNGGALTGTPTETQEQQTKTVAQRRYLPSITEKSQLAAVDPGTAVVSSSRPLNLYGWITPWNIDTAASSTYTAASAFWLTVNEDGITFAPKADWGVWQAFKEKQKLTETYLTVSGDPDATYIALSNADAQSKHIAALLALTKEQGFAGVDIDYEALGTENRELFTAFIRNLSNVFHQQGKKVAVTLEARIANQVPMDWRAVGQLADEVRIMAFDYHANSTIAPGPIAPVSWVAEVAAYATDRIEPHKVVIGLGNYGYDWSEPQGADTTWTGVGVSFEQATALANEQKAEIIRRTGIDDRGYDVGTAPAFTYIDSQNRTHEVWFEDAASLQEKMNAVAAYQVKGIVFWSVGSGDPTLNQKP